MVATAAEYATVEKLWPGSTIVCLATGPSLMQSDVDACRGRAKVIAIKDAIDMAPWAGCLYGCGLDSSRWWARHGDRVTVLGRLQFTLDPAAAKWAQVLKNLGETGLSTDPVGLKTGKNSLYQSINLAVLLGAQRIVLLGADMGHTPHGAKYFFGNRAPGHQVDSPFGMFLQLFETIVDPLRAAGVDIINCSRVTALKSFRCQPLSEALQ